MIYPSTAHIWFPCPGSASLASGHPADDKTTSQREGDAAHYALAVLLSPNPPLLVGTVAPNGVLLDDEIIEHAAMAADAIRSASHNGSIEAERKIDIKRIHETMSGRPDVFSVDPVGLRATIWDFKYGHREVDPYKNPQMICEAAGLFDLYPDAANWSFRFVIIQPRCYTAEPVRDWVVTGKELLVLFSQYNAAARLATSPNPQTNTGTQCRDCAARHTCKALSGSVGFSVDVSMSASERALSVESAARELAVLDDAGKRIEARRSGLEAYLIAQVRSGAVAPGWQLDQKLTAQKWTKTDAEVRALGLVLGVNLDKAPALITPFQAKKAGIDESVINAYSGRVLGEVSLKRTNINKVEKAFNNGK